MELSDLIDFNRYSQYLGQFDSAQYAAVKTREGKVAGLSFCVYQQSDTPSDVIILYHGGGVHRNAGYPVLAYQLCVDPRIAVCLVDIRGHGKSDGKRGSVAQPELIWRDVDTIVDEITRCFPYAQRHLAGHSSGAGMLINYFTRYNDRRSADSLTLLAPELGPFAGIARPIDEKQRFAQVRQWPFIVNAISAGYLFGQCWAVKLNFPEQVLKAAPDFVSRYSVNMANALTPRHPAKQLSSLPVPTLLLFAQNDELFDSEAMRDFANQHGSELLQSHEMPGATHLACVFEAHHYMAPFIAGLSPCE
ncbi:alpha/beta fold hydrolase [Vibrio sp. H11]|uniref:alpha/beta fold hydrolase n=1 Tax=Vibrio sp. H11 TaxID=2565928 RepID=UPI0010A5A765|nr:alpha/beta fold hydrolase [Vibrio sp. H11]